MDKVESLPARWLAIAVFCTAVVPVAGCRICADCEDIAYPAYGGAWQRTQRDHGRVGSLFDPGGAKASELVARDLPPDPDELERERQQARGGRITSPEEAADGEDDDVKSDEERKQEYKDKADELRQKRLEDIEGENEEELRKKDLDDINVHIVPGQPMPPVLK